MYFSSSNDLSKESSSPAPSAPQPVPPSPPQPLPFPSHFEYPATATGIPVNMTNQTNSPSPPATTTLDLHSHSPVAWTTSLCDCCDDVSSCCLTCWCPCIAFGRIAEIVDRGSTCVTGVASNGEGGLRLEMVIGTEKFILLCKGKYGIL
ncbi:hypothetical protein L1049_005939 [Liquidambar formosana]|uniref:Uncharacterized protein n=1 Tax=Liquidambar formosana TaxID=63359 RepID=A0AAP0RGU7_LIQFO